MLRHSTIFFDCFFFRKFHISNQSSLYRCHDLETPNSEKQCAWNEPRISIEAFLLSSCFALRFEVLLKTVQDQMHGFGVRKRSDKNKKSKKEWGIKLTMTLIIHSFWVSKWFTENRNDVIILVIKKLYPFNFTFYILIRIFPRYL